MSTNHAKAVEAITAHLGDYIAPAAAVAHHPCMGDLRLGDYVPGVGTVESIRLDGDRMSITWLLMDGKTSVRTGYRVKDAAFMGIVHGQ